jgi:cytochrome c oxidase cbb3-type subunit III
MPRVLPAGAGVALALCALQLVSAAQSTLRAQSTTPGVADAGGFPAPTPALERGRAIYVLNHCHFCHGTDLRRAVMGASDLLRSPLIGSDQDGELLGAVVRAGRPNLQTAMPRYDLTATELTDLARYIHYLRQTGRYADLTGAPRDGGNSGAGESYFSRRCASCHSVEGDLKGLASKYEAAALRAQVLRPSAFAPIEGASTAGRRAHLQLLEQHSDMDFADLMAYLEMAGR